MTILLSGRSIHRVAIIDDDEEVREAYKEPVTDLGLVPLVKEGPLGDFEQFVRKTQQEGEAAICDHHLGKRGSYATFDGARAVAEWYQRQFPALLCTTWEAANIDDLRAHRRYLPVLLKPSELEPDTIKKGLEICINEFNGKFRSSRKSWRVQLRVESVDPAGSNRDRCVFVSVTGWKIADVIRLRMDRLPDAAKATIENGAVFLHARANLGAERHEDIYFYDWEEN